MLNIKLSDQQKQIAEHIAEHEMSGPIDECIPVYVERLWELAALQQPERCPEFDVKNSTLPELTTELDFKTWRVLKHTAHLSSLSQDDQDWFFFTYHLAFAEQHMSGCYWRVKDMLAYHGKDASGVYRELARELLPSWRQALFHAHKTDKQYDRVAAYYSSLYYVRLIRAAFGPNST